MLSTLLMPNCTVKPTAPRAITTPEAMPKPIASMSSLIGRGPSSPASVLSPTRSRRRLPAGGDSGHPAPAAPAGVTLSVLLEDRQHRRAGDVAEDAHAAVAVEGRGREVPRRVV